MDKRLITEKQEQALRFCHQDFDGLSQTEAAKKMGISQAAISKLLAGVKKVLPQFFPILTKLEAKCYHFYMVEGWSVKEIAFILNSTPDTVYKALERVKDKGMYFNKTKGRVLSYDPLIHDHRVKKKF